MTALEDRLREAISAATSTVPDDAAVNLERKIGQRLRTARRRPRLARFAVPIAAAAAVVAVAIVVPNALHQAAPPANGQSGGLGLAVPDPRVALTFTPGIDVRELQIRSIATGAVLSTLRLPQPPGAHGKVFLSGYATNGSTYLIAESPGLPDPCQSWIYALTVSPDGSVSTLQPFAPLPHTASEIEELAISAKGDVVSYEAASGPGFCLNGPNLIATVNLRTHATKLWHRPVPLEAGGARDYGFGLTGNGRLLLTDLSWQPAVLRELPLTSPSGQAARYWRTIRAPHPAYPQVGIAGGVMTPDGKTLIGYAIGGKALSIYSTSLATGQTKTLWTSAIPSRFESGPTTDPTVRTMLIPTPSGVVSLNLRTGSVSHLTGAWRTFSGDIIW